MTIIDVRTPGEFMGGHISGSINIPLQLIPERVEEIRSMKQPIVLCCASGGRSGQATAFLRGHGINCENGGSWMDAVEREDLLTKQKAKGKIQKAKTQ